MLMGGFDVKRKEQLLRPVYEPKEEMNQYGEFGQKLIGLFQESKGVKIISRVWKWVIQKAGTQAKKQEQVQSGDRFTRQDSKTWRRMRQIQGQVLDVGYSRTLDLCQ